MKTKIQGKEIVENPLPWNERSPLQAVQRAAAAGAGALQAGLQGDLPRGQHGGGAGHWWLLSLSGGCLYEGKITIVHNLIDGSFVESHLTLAKFCTFIFVYSCKDLQIKNPLSVSIHNVFIFRHLKPFSNYIAGLLSFPVVKPQVPEGEFKSQQWVQWVLTAGVKGCVVLMLYSSSWIR